MDGKARKHDEGETSLSAEAVLPESAVDMTADSTTNEVEAGPGQPLSTITDHPDQGGDEETDDGLNATAEATRHAAEDEPTKLRTRRSEDSVPVFDRGGAPPKI